MASNMVPLNHTGLEGMAEVDTVGAAFEKLKREISLELS